MWNNKISKKQYFGTIVGEMWKIPKPKKTKQKNTHNSLVLLAFSTFHLQESQDFVFVCVFWLFLFFGFVGIFHISTAKTPKYWLFWCFVFWYFPHFTYKNPKIVFLLNVENTTIVFCYFVFSIFHFQKYRFWHFHISPPRIRFCVL